MDSLCTPHIWIVRRQPSGPEFVSPEDFARRFQCDLFLEYYKQWEALKAKELIKQLTDENSRLRKIYLEEKILEGVSTTGAKRIMIKPSRPEFGD